MKYLKIEDNKGLFTINGNDWEAIDKIGKEDIMKLLDFIIETDFEMDEYDEEKLANQAHQIIYSNLYLKFSEVITNKTKFKDESAVMYKEAINKYSR